MHLILGGFNFIFHRNCETDGDYVSFKSALIVDHVLGEFESQKLRFFMMQICTNRNFYVDCLVSSVLFSARKRRGVNIHLSAGEFSYSSLPLVW